MNNFDKIFNAFKDASLASLFTVTYKNEAERFYQLATVQRERERGHTAAGECLTQMKRVMSAQIVP